MLSSRRSSAVGRSICCHVRQRRPQVIGHHLQCTHHAPAAGARARRTASPRRSVSARNSNTPTSREQKQHNHICTEHHPHRRGKTREHHHHYIAGMRRKEGALKARMLLEIQQEGRREILNPSASDHHYRQAASLLHNKMFKINNVNRTATAKDYH